MSSRKKNPDPLGFAKSSVIDTVDIPLDRIKPYWRNPKKNDAAVDPVARSIADYGMNQPLVLDRELVIIVGHTRYRALKKLEWKTAPCVVRDMPAEKARAYRIIDNKTNELADWEQKDLIAELREVVGAIDMSIYFPKTNLAAMLAQSDVRPPTAAEIAAEKTRLETQFEKQPEEEIKLACPHCNQPFYIKKYDLLRKG